MTLTIPKSKILMIMAGTAEIPQEDPRFTAAKLKITGDERFRNYSPQLQVESALQTVFSAVRGFSLGSPDALYKEELGIFAQAAQEVLRERFDTFVEMLPGLEATRVGSQWVYDVPKVQPSSAVA